MQEDVYREWCLEFFSTLFMNESIKTDNITKEVCVWFRLCGQNFESLYQNSRLYLVYIKKRKLMKRVLQST